jgi:hypothetical protein
MDARLTGWAAGLAVLLLVGSASAAAPAGARVLSIGRAGYLDAGVARSVGAELARESGDARLQDFAVIVLADVAYESLPTSVREGLVEYVGGGGCLWLTGGAQAFGSGGYQEVADVLPFELRGRSDWRAVHFRPPVVLVPSHPVLSGVTFGTIGALNDMNLRPGATELVRAAGGGSAGGGAYPYPLMAEAAIGSGRVLGVAFDLNDARAVPDRERFVGNVLGYLLRASRAGRTGP